MRLINFAQRNIKEMLRDPILYVMCIGFPVLMFILFSIINHFQAIPLEMFTFPSLLPGIMMFSGSFTMLMLSLLVSKDRQSAFLIRLYSSPMKSVDFVGGYLITGFIIGIAQQLVCVLTAFILSAATGAAFVPVEGIPLLLLSQLPMLLINMFLGILFGTILNEKGAPGICSVFISASGILGGAWMPLDTMGGFESFCSFLPFYPTVYWGRIITGAKHTVTVDMNNPTAMDTSSACYTFDSIAQKGIIVISVFLLLVIVLSIVSFARKRKV